MGESRTELLAWVNDLLQFNYTKVEQAGTGAAYCQIMDSIFHDVHLNKVKFDTKHEYEYVSNFKVLQHTFDKHKVDKIIPVDKLIKCKFQDNLEFMQWMKRYWEQNYQGGEYDAVQRRRSGGASTIASPAMKSVRSNTGAAVMARKSPAAVKSRNTPTGRLSFAKGDNTMVQDLSKQITELKVTVDGLEKERDFYFGKLREIEILVQEQIDMIQGDPGCLEDIQAILYRTEEGFEVPPEDIIDDDDDETF